MSLFKNKFRNETIRFQNWDYRLPGRYFVTICTREREYLFGIVKNKKMVINEYGKIVHDEWIKTGELRPYIILDNFIVMPDHFHAIVVIPDDTEAIKSKYIGSRRRFGGIRGNSETVSALCRDVARNVPTQGGINPNKSKTMSSISPKSGSLSVIIRSFKSACSKRILNKFVINKKKEQVDFIEKFL